MHPTWIPSSMSALAGLRRINRVTRSAAILWPAIAGAAAEIHPTSLRVLDLACGAGDNALTVAQMARRSGEAIEVHGCDISPVAIAERNVWPRRSSRDDKFFSCDVLREALPTGYHVVMCSLFLHHLQREQAIGLIGRMAAAAEPLARSVSDLRRTWIGLSLAWIGSRLLTRSPIVHTDAVRSVAGAFVESEIEGMIRECGLQPSHSKITRHWPERWLLRLEKP